MIFYNVKLFKRLSSEENRLTSNSLWKSKSLSTCRSIKAAGNSSAEIGPNLGILDNGPPRINKLINGN